MRWGKPCFRLPHWCQHNAPDPANVAPTSLHNEVRPEVGQSTWHKRDQMNPQRSR